MMNLTSLKKAFASFDCTQIFIKELSENDNSKNQIYFGPSFAALNIFPNKGIEPAKSNSNAIFYAPLDFFWMNENGELNSAPNTRMILYPQYPEVRLSGFLKGVESAPSDLMTSRRAGRLLFLGVTSNSMIIAYITDPDTPLAREFRSLKLSPNAGVFSSLPCKIKGKDNPKKIIISALKRIHNLGWIKSKRLLSGGGITECRSSNCGGYTLEAELGITPNGFSEPDYCGWEVKQHSVADFTKYQSSVITLMTPEPTGGFYHDAGVHEFLRKFGYKDKKGRKDRINFGGVHHANIQHSQTKLTLKLVGYDFPKNRIIDEQGGIALVTEENEIAALWAFSGLMRHWKRKHTQAVYVPSIMRKKPFQQYYYGNIIRLGIGTDFLKFLNAINLQKIYYDPGIKMEKASAGQQIKRRNQFRIKSSDLIYLYDNHEFVTL